MKVPILAALLLAPDAAFAACAEGRAELRGDFGSAGFTVELADDAAERAQGLMHREHLPKSSGMLFVYERAQPASFWMENTLIPLDMLFLDEAGTVVKVHENAVPLDRTPIPGGEAIRAVLEINGGLARAMGIEEGAELRHTAMPQETAAWSCAD